MPERAAQGAGTGFLGLQHTRCAGQCSGSSLPRAGCSRLRARHGDDQRDREAGSRSARGPRAPGSRSAASPATTAASGIEQIGQLAPSCQGSARTCTPSCSGFPCTTCEADAAAAGSAIASRTNRVGDPNRRLVSSLFEQVDETLVSRKSPAGIALFPACSQADRHRWYVCAQPFSVVWPGQTVEPGVFGEQTRHHFIERHYCSACAQARASSIDPGRRGSASGSAWRRTPVRQGAAGPAGSVMPPSAPACTSSAGGGRAAAAASDRRTGRARGRGPARGRAPAHRRSAPVLAPRHGPQPAATISRPMSRPST